MSSSDEAEGRRLLQAWKATGAGIEMSFTDWEAVFGFKFVGQLNVELSTDERLFLEGTGCEVFLDIREASFKNIVSKEGLKQNALPSSMYGETLTISFVDKGDFTLVTRPRPDASERVH